MNRSHTTSFAARAGAVLALLLLSALAAAAQVTTGSLSGTVLDPNGAAVAGATVRVTNVDTGISRETTTNSEGFYRVTNLIPGANYRVEVTATGFTARPVENISVRAATENTADVKVGLQNVGETVNVQATDQALIQTEQTQLAHSYTPQQLTQLPYVGSIDNLALLTPGVVTPGDADFANGVGISANGNRGRSNNFQIDGQDNNDNSVAGPALSITNAEAIGDYQVITNTFSAEFGRNSGAQINVVTKSGTNEFHGSLFEFHRNAALNARDNIEKQSQRTFNFLANNGFTQFSGLARRYLNAEPFRENRFGGAIGGPIVRNKAFFFTTYEGTYFRGETNANNLGGGFYTPNAEGGAAVNRVFGNAATGALTSTAIGGGPVFVQGVGTTFIAPPTLDTDGDGVPDTFAFGPDNPFGAPATPGFLAPLAVIADPTAPGGRRTIFGGDIVRLFPNQSTTHQSISRVDYNVTSRDSLVGRYIYDNSKFPLATGRFTAGAVFDVPSTNNNLGITYTRTVSSRTVNEGRYNFSRLQVRFGDPTGTLPGPGISFSTAGTPSIAAAATGFVGGFLLNFGTQNTFPQSRKVDTHQLQDTVSTTLGNHAVKAGADIRFQRVDNFFLPNFLGTYVFRSGGSVPAGTFFNYGTNGLNGSNRTSPSGFENFLLGRPRDVQFALGNPRIKTNQNDYFFFVQDSWRARPNLTLDFGLRYEVSTTPFNPIIREVNAREADPNRAIFDPKFPLSARTTQELPIDKNNFQPNVGFAWQPNFKFLGDRFSNGRTVVRGAFRLAYDPPYFNIVLNTVTAAPFAAAGFIRQTPGAAPALQFPFRPQTTAELNQTPGTNGGDPRLFNQTRVDPNLYNPYTLQFNFGVQQELFKNSVLEVRYVHNRIVGQFQTVNGNPDVSWLNRAAQCLGQNPGAFTSGAVVGTPAASAASACAGNGFNNNVGTNGNGRVDPNFGITRTRINGASSTYDGMQTRFDTRFRNDLVLNVNYTWSKAIDNASEIFATFGGGQTVPHSQNPFDTTRGERGLSAFHRKHNFTANGIYQLPWYKEQRGFVGHALGGFQIAGIVRFASGQPYTPTELFGNYDPGFDVAFVSGVGSLRPFNGNPNAPVGTIAYGVTAACSILFGGPACAEPNAVPGNFIIYNTRQRGSVGTVVTAQQALQQSRLIYNDFGLFTNFAASGFAATDFEAFNLFRTPYGNVGRNTFFGESLALVNASLFKTTKVTENVKLEFRAEATNLLNHRNFGVPDPIAEDAFSNFSVSTFQNPGFNNGGNRGLRFGLRLLF